MKARTKEDFATISFLGFILCFLMAFGASCIPSKAHADEYSLHLKPFVQGIVLITAPIPMTGKDLPWDHSIGLSCISYAGTQLGFEFFPKKYGFLSPIIVGGFDIIYRAGEWKEPNDLAKRKLACDLLGVATAIVGRIEF